MSIQEKHRACSHPAQDAMLRDTHGLHFVFPSPAVTITSGTAPVGTAPEDNKRASPELPAAVKNCLAKG